MDIVLINSPDIDYSDRGWALNTFQIPDKVYCEYKGPADWFISDMTHQEQDNFVDLLCLSEGYTIIES